MSFRNIPLTDNCESIDVMGRRIIESTVRRKTGNETVINNWQPFQIHGGRVTPVRVTTGTETYEHGPIFMPLINGFPMDDPSAKLTGEGDVYLNVKFTFDANNHFIIDAGTPPYISLRRDGGVIQCTRSYSTGARTMSGNSVASWKLGAIRRPIENTLRYFNGYKKQWDDAESEDGPIYGKGPGIVGTETFEDDWPVVNISVSVVHEYSIQSTPVPPGGELVYEYFDFGRFSNLSNAAWRSASGTGTGMDYGGNGGPPNFALDLLTTFATEALIP